VLVVILLLTSFKSNVVLADSSKDSFIEQYNILHMHELLNQAYQRAVFLNKNIKGNNPPISVEGGSFYTEAFDHYVFGSGKKELEGFLITYSTYSAKSYPYHAYFSVSEIQSFSGSVSVSGQVTASLENAIIGGISSSLGYQTTFETGYQTGVNAGITVDIPANVIYTISAWYQAVSSSGTAYYRWYDVTGNSGIIGKPCGALTPLKYTGSSVIYFDGHPGTEP